MKMSGRVDHQILCRFLMQVCLFPVLLISAAAPFISKRKSFLPVRPALCHLLAQSRTVCLTAEVFRAEVQQRKRTLIDDSQFAPAGKSAVLFRFFLDFPDSVRIPIHEKGINTVEFAVYGFLLPVGVACLLSENRVGQAAVARILDFRKEVPLMSTV